MSKIRSGRAMDKLSPLNLIANLLGVSKMTVSRALREGTSVAPELRAKIRECARKLDYQPDSRISQVMRAVRKAQPSSYRETLAFVQTHRLSDRADRASVSDHEFEGANRRAEQLGYRLDVFRLSDESLTRNALSHILSSRGIRGVLISPPGVDGIHLRLDWKQFCCVLLDDPFAHPGLPRVLHDHYSGCVLTLRRLRQQRYVRIGLVISRAMDERSARLIRSAFTSFHPMNSKEAEKLIFTDDHYNPKVLKKWMTQGKPEVIVAYFEEAFPSLQQIRDLAPDRTAITTLNWDKSQPGIAGIDQHRSIIGEQAVDLLLLRLQGNQFGLDPLAPSIKVPGSWVDAASIRKEKSLPG